MNLTETAMQHFNFLTVMNLKTFETGIKPVNKTQTLLLSTSVAFNADCGNTQPKQPLER